MSFDRFIDGILCRIPLFYSLADAVGPAWSISYSLVYLTTLGTGASRLTQVKDLCFYCARMARNQQRASIPRRNQGHKHGDGAFG